MSPRPPAPALELAPQRTLVYGLGRSGSAVVRHLARLGWPGAWWDASPTAEHAREATGLGYSRLTELQPAAHDLVVAAPGVPIDHPDLCRLRAAGLEVIGEAELCYRTVATPLIGVTGTAGKSSTTAWIAHLLRGQGLRALEGGNIDPALLDVAPGAGVAVVELSSFQLERVVRFRTPVAVVTNLDVDHLDRHGTVEAYHAAKLNLLRTLGPGDALVKPADLRLPVPHGVRTLGFAADTSPVVDLDGRPLLDASELPDGQHPQNARAAALAALAYLEHAGLAPDLQAFRDALRRYRGIGGRSETVAIVDGTRFIEDSIATRTIAARAALENAPAPIAWIVGGEDKGAELAPLIDLVRSKVRVILAIGRDGPAIAARFSPVPVEVVREADGRRALEAACRLGLERARGGSVLLAPLGASFDQFRDYKARGAAFRAAADGLAAEVGAA